MIHSVLGALLFGDGVVVVGTCVVLVFVILEVVDYGQDS